MIPWFKQAFTEEGQSVCQGRWLAIRKGNKTCYAQWEDCGPFRTDHFQYVFQNERPKPNLNRGAGLDVSPAVRDYLGLGPTDVTDWQFVEVRDVPPGPWRNYGDNNHFVIAKRQSEQQRRSGHDGQERRSSQFRGCGTASDGSPPSRAASGRAKVSLSFSARSQERLVAFALSSCKRRPAAAKASEISL